MENLKSLADQLREEMGKPAPAKNARTAKAPASNKSKRTANDFPIIESIKAFDNSQCKTLAHVRFDEKTVDLMNKLKIATGIDVTRLVAFSVHQLFGTHPELKQTIKNYLQNLDL